MRWTAIESRVRAAEKRLSALRAVSTVTSQERFDRFRQVAEVETELAAIWTGVGNDTPVGSAMRNILWSAAFDAARLHQLRAEQARADMARHEPLTAPALAGGSR